LPFNAGSCPIGSEDVSFTSFKFRGNGKDFGEFEVDQAKFPEMRRVSDITWLGVIVPDAIFIF
jgi:hypothetical protein